MATPLRKDEPQFDQQEEITTADLAQGKRPVSDMRGPQPVVGDRSAEVKTASNEEKTSNWGTQNRAEASDATPLFPSAELEGLRTRWQTIQTGFVDEPRKAVQDADGLVASAMKRLAEVFADERAKLERQWDRGDSVSTEDLRVALQRYRAFFDRLLSI